MGGRLRGHDVGGEVDVCAPSAGCQDDVGGAAAVAQGGSFLHGFAANAIGAAAGVVSDAVSMGNDILDTAIVAAAGCAGAVFSGGKCANGAVTAAMASLFNGDWKAVKRLTKPGLWSDPCGVRGGLLLVCGGGSSRGSAARKNPSRPSYKKVGVNMVHVRDNHTSGGMGAISSGKSHYSPTL